MTKLEAVNEYIRTNCVSTGTGPLDGTFDGGNFIDLTEEDFANILEIALDSLVMKKYHVTYFYLATGMEGVPDEQDHGVVQAYSASEAKDKVIEKKYGKAAGTDSANWLKGCLTAKEVL